MITKSQIVNLKEGDMFLMVSNKLEYFENNKKYIDSSASTGTYSDVLDEILGTVIPFIKEEQTDNAPYSFTYNTKEQTGWRIYYGGIEKIVTREEDPEYFL